MKYSKAWFEKNICDEDCEIGAGGGILDEIKPCSARTARNMYLLLERTRAYMLAQAGNSEEDYLVLNGAKQLDEVLAAYRNETREE